MTSYSHIPELLAPAGGPESLRAAIANGADAVYLGVDRLNARRGAENFTIDTLAEACRSAHLRGVRVYLTANVLVLPDEMDDALALVSEAWQAGVDAVIVQDVGLLALVREYLPEVRVHSSTQMNVHNSSTIRVLSEMGVSRVTLSREVSVAEIAEFVSHARDIQVESFVHGALCMCYSGQCLLSSLIGGRSANRGMCAQPCRLPYELVDGSGVAAAVPGAYLLSPRDLAGISQLPALTAAGVSALKIEGRMKSPEYVALVTGVYRAALDRLTADGDAFEVRDGELDVLSEAFNRGFSPAYLAGERGNDMMSYTRPNNRGVLVGRVVSAEKGRATVALDRRLASADTIEFWTRSGRFAQRAGALDSSAGTPHSAPAGTRVSLEVDGPVYPGDRVFRVANDELLSAARRSFSSEGPERSLSARVRVVCGEPLLVEVVDDRGRVGRAEGPTVEAARTKSVTAEEITEHVGRLGGTPYRVERWDIDLSPGAGVGFSALHRLRREALSAYESSLVDAWARRTRYEVVAPCLQRPSGAVPKSRPRIVAATDSLEIARVALDAGADEVHVPTWALARSVAVAGVIPVLPRISHDRESAAALSFVEHGDAAVAGTLGSLAEAASVGANVAAHWSLNAANPWTIDALRALGAREVWLSPELTGAQIALVTASATVPVGVGVWGRQEVMVTEHCILMSLGECDRRCGTCDRRHGDHVLRDRKGYEFPVRTDVTGRTHVYNSVPLDLTRVLPDLIAAGVGALRVDLDAEAPDRAARAVAGIRESVDRILAGAPPLLEQPPGTTTGHYFRGVG